jgi:hypothetical protein
MPPLAAGAHEVEEVIQQLSHVRGPRPLPGLGGRDQRLQQAKLIIGQCLAGAEVPNQRAISGRPRGGLQLGNHLNRDITPMSGNASTPGSRCPPIESLARDEPGDFSRLASPPRKRECGNGDAGS